MASDTHDDGFHEVQLNGKQLVFLFMAVTVVSVIIFLCGVLVGRGVKAERVVSSADAAAVAAVAEPAPPPPALTPAPAAGSDPTTAAPPPAVGDLTYFNRLEKRLQPVETLKAVSAAPAPTPAVAPVSRQPRHRSRPSRFPKTAPTPASVSPTVMASDGYVVQVAAVPQPDADTIARRLTSKGYGVFIVAPGPASPSLYRVRVGKFKTRREAEAVASKLQKEEQFKPWITR